VANLSVPLAAKPDSVEVEASGLEPPPPPPPQAVKADKINTVAGTDMHFNFILSSLFEAQ
jgi:hypothetical protein